MQVQSRSEQGLDSPAGERRPRSSKTLPRLVLEASCWGSEGSWGLGPQRGRTRVARTRRGGWAGRRPAMWQRDHQEQRALGYKHWALFTHNTADVIHQLFRPKEERD